MAGEGGRLEADPVFLGLTRPAMMLGVTYSWFMLNGMLWTLYFINTSDFIMMLPGATFTHIVGYLICSREARFMDIWMVKLSKCMRCRNKTYHGFTNSYDLF